MLCCFLNLRDLGIEVLGRPERDTRLIGILTMLKIL